MKQIIAAAALILLCALVKTKSVYAQPKPSISISYEAMPSSKFSDPEAGLEDGEIQIDAIALKASYPLVFSQGKTVLVTEVNYQHRDLDYSNFGGIQTDIGAVHSANLTFMVQHVLSERWSLLGMAIPGFASDVDDKLVSQDLSFQAILAFMRQVSPKFTWGFGGAYSTGFGRPFPFPVLALNWNNGKNMRWENILPVSSEFWYAPNPKLELGLVFGVNGDLYQGDPDKYGVGDPEMEYSTITFGPAVRYRLTEWVNLNLEGGIVGLHRFDFYDRNDKVETRSLKASGYIRVGLGFGG